MIATIRRIVTGTAIPTKKGGAMLGLPSLAASQVTLVTDEGFCLRALQVQDSLVHATNASAPAVIPARGLYVIRLGTFMAVADPGPRIEGAS